MTTLSLSTGRDIAPKCRHCGTELSLKLIDLGMSPVANDYVDPENYNRAEPFYPLEAFVCRECRLVQTRDLLAGARAVLCRCDGRSLRTRRRLTSCRDCLQ